MTSAQQILFSTLKIFQFKYVWLQSLHLFSSTCTTPLSRCLIFTSISSFWLRGHSWWSVIRISHIQFILGVLNRCQWLVQILQSLFKSMWLYSMFKQSDRVCPNLITHYSVQLTKRGVSIMFKHHIQEHGLSFHSGHSFVSFRVFSGLLQADQTCLHEAVLKPVSCFLLNCDQSLLFCLFFHFSFCWVILSIQRAMNFIYALCTQSLPQFV